MLKPPAQRHEAQATIVAWYFDTSLKRKKKEKDQDQSMVLRNEQLRVTSESTHRNNFPHPERSQSRRLCLLLEFHVYRSPIFGLRGDGDL